MSKLLEEWDMTEESHNSSQLRKIEANIRFYRNCRRIAFGCLIIYLTVGAAWLFLSWRW